MDLQKRCCFIIQLIHESWPDVLKPYRLNANGLAYNASDNDIKALRGAGVNTILQVSDGTIYAPLGGGITSAKGSAQAMIQKNKIAKKVKAKERDLPDRLQHIGGLMAKEGAVLPIDPVFKLIRRENKLWVAETKTGFELPLSEI
jgi:hypothetical protein